jgi:type VI protein secretion system component Hcp
MRILTAIIGGALLALSPGASASLRGWLDFGPETPGEATDPGHVGWALVETFSAGKDEDGFKITCHRAVDKASPLLMKACATGKHFATVKLEVAKLTPGGPVNFWEVTFKDVTISSYSGLGTTEGSSANEELCLRWKSLVVTYRVFPPGGIPYPVSAIVSPDTDRDGLPDAYEESVGLNAAISNLRLDSDNDGVSDVDEYRLGTHPNDPTSFFNVVATLEDPATGELRLTWPSVSGENYSIVYSPDLATPFVPIATLTATGPQSSHTVTRTLPVGFFKVSRELP